MELLLLLMQFFQQQHSLLFQAKFGGALLVLKTKQNWTVALKCHDTELKAATCLLKYTVPTKRINARKPRCLFSVSVLSRCPVIFFPNMNPACWKKVLKKVAFPKDLKYDMKSQPVDMNSVCIVDSSLSLGIDARSGSFFNAEWRWFKCMYLVELNEI